MTDFKYVMPYRSYIGTRASDEAALKATWNHIPTDLHVNADH
jgi:hypothetical protein